MICNFMLTITLLISGPTKENTFGILKVEQYRFSDFTKASSMASTYILSVGAGLLSKNYPRTIGVDLQELKNIKCNYNGEKY